MKSMRLLYLFIIVSSIMIVMLSFSSASTYVQSLKSQKQNTCVELPQSCPTCQFVYLEGVQLPSPSSKVIMIETNMSKKGLGQYNYTFCNTSLIGWYTVIDYLDGNETANYDFEITPSGFLDTTSFYFILIIILALVIIMGFYLKEPWFVVIGGFGLMILGLYTWNQGMAGMRDDFMTRAISLFEIAIGAVLGIGSAYQKIDGD